MSGDIDLTTPDGQFQARILGAVAKKESDDKSRRIRRKHEEIAASGRVSGGGSRPYGYEPDKVTLRPAEAAEIAACAKRLLAGEPIRSIARDLNERGVASASGGLWSPQSLRRMLASPRISGQRAHHGEIVATAEWPGIISAKEGAAIRALLANPERRTNKAARRYLLGGLLALQPLRGAAGRPAACGWSAPLRLREGAGLLRLRQDLRQRGGGRAVRDRGRPAPARLGRAGTGDGAPPAPGT